MLVDSLARCAMHIRNGRGISSTQQDASTMSVSKMPGGTADHHRHATPEPTVAERPHGHKEAAQQVAPVTSVAAAPGDSPYATWDQLYSAMAATRNVMGGPWESGTTFPILPEVGSSVQAFSLRICSSQDAPPAG